MQNRLCNIIIEVSKNYYIFKAMHFKLLSVEERIFKEEFLLIKTVAIQPQFSCM